MSTCDSQAIDLAQSYINISSIYSEMRKNDISLTYAKMAVDTLDPEYERRYSQFGTGLDLEFATIAASAFHNAAVGYEIAGDFSSSLIYYSKAVKVSKIHLGHNHPLTSKFENNFQEVKARIK